ncbi:MAG: DUF2318 domain-containing protein [Lachnospiraceae bacterium]|nr:DUF2318 domain-containing protein [Lachnospiraceae bacterium]
MKKWVLPVIAVTAVITAVIVVLIFRDRNEGKGTSVSESPAVVSDSDVITGSDKDLLIRKTELSTEKVSFIRPIEESKIELLARIGEDGEIKIVLGICQSCNGAPGAYYIQKGDQLQCNNCGLTFPLNVLDSPGGGCHPIMLNESVFTKTKEGIIIHTDLLAQYEELFNKVAEH